MYLTSNHDAIDKEIADLFAATLAHGIHDDTVERLMAVVQPHLDELRAVRDRKHEEYGRLVRASQATHDELETTKKELRRLRNETATEKE